MSPVGWAGLAIVIVVIIVAVVVVVVPRLSGPTPASTSPPGPKTPAPTPIGTALALGTPREAAKGTHNWYNFSVQSAGGGLWLGNLSLQVQTASGAVVPPTTLWSVSILSITGTAVATYSMLSDTWTQGGALAVTSQQEIVLDASTDQLSGDVLIVIGGGAFSGTISVAIP